MAEKNKMKSSLKTYSVLFWLIFIMSCTQPAEEIVVKEITQIDTTKLYGYWEHIGISNSNFKKNKPNFGNIYGEDRGCQWIFRNDSIFITNYPLELEGQRHFTLKQDSIIFHNIYYSSPSRNKVSFSGDTLILRGKKGNDLITYYFRKSKKNKKELDFLISEKLDWSLFTNQVLYNANQKNAKDSLFPYISYLDLRESNSNNFSTSKDTLFYRDSLGNYAFEFESQNDNNIMSYISLTYLSETLPEQTLFFKKK